MTTIKHIAGAGALLILPQLALADRPPQAVCQKMVEGDPSGQITMEECLCTYNVADTVLDDDIKALLFQSWYTGENVTEQLEALPEPKRVQKQFKTMERTFNKNCL
ncbi:hypothetical protein [uncultured Ruegeria sp.]|uniref:hypothetical protein n=1 Tax=uncultured Ruegeria sp. TaxID=259304 RepID=UPI002609C143|nr:hypothetical protein [uncultured Ruegeria sp.]